MNERKDVGALSSLLRSKTIIIAAVAAVAMVLGAMSVGAAVNQYQKRAVQLGGFPASANPFARRTPTSRHTLEGAAPTPQVAAAETEASDQADTTVAETDSSASAANEDADGSATPPIAAVPAPTPPQVTVPVAAVTQPVVNAVQPVVSPILPPPVQQLLNSVTNTLPTNIDTGLIKITLPKIGL